MRKNLLFLIIISLFSTASFAQAFSNEGKDFWIPYPEHIDGTLSAMGIYITGDVNAIGNIAVGAVNIPFTLTANAVVYKFIGPNAAGNAANNNVYLGGFQDNVIAGKGIHVTSNVPVVVFAHIIRSARSGATLALPSTVWGKEYIVPSYANSGGTGVGQGYGVVDVIASIPNTVVEITPTATTRNGLHPIGTPFTITLPNVGDIYQLEFAQNADMSGTKIKSIASGTSGCNPIAVFSATTWSAINCNSGNGGDNFYQQLFPTGTWGKQFVTGPLKKVATNAADNNVDAIRVFVSDPTTVVTRISNGVISTLTGLTVSNYYEYSSSLPTLLQADKPIQVVQYITTQGCGNPQTQSDPEMIVLSSVEQTINDITVIAATTSGGPTNNGIVPTGQSAVTTHYINVLMKTNNTSSFRINGAIPAATFTAIPGTNYSFLKENISARVNTNGVNPTSRLTADSGFNAIAYGFGNVESYGYNAGTSVRDFNQQLFTPSQFGILNDGNSYACLNTPFNFNVYLPETAISNSGASAGTAVPIRYDSMRWNVTSATNFVPNNFPVMVRPLEQLPIPGGPFLPYYPNPVVREDSIRIRNGKSVAFYSLPSQYAITSPGTYTISVRGYRTNANGDGCTSGNEIDFDFTLVVPNAPIASFTNTQPGCPADSVYFTETNIQTPPSSSTYLFTWNFGDPASGAANTSTLRDPVHRFSGPGSYTVTFSNITAAGCVSATTSLPVVVPNLVNATIAGTTAVCQNATPPNISFIITPGLAPYLIKYTLSTNGGAPVLQPDIITSALINTIPAPTGVAGTFAYTFTSVENANAAFCTVPIGQTATITVNPLPTATIAGTIDVCQNSTAPTVTFTGANATAPYTFTYNINGGANQTITTTTGNSVTLAAPTTTVGTYNYNLVSVKDASSTLCTNPVVGIATVVVQAKPNATIAGTVSLCQDATAPNITFNGINGNAPFTFTYNINGGATQTVSSSVTSNSVTVPVSMATTGTFIYNLLSVQNTGPTTCITNITGASAIVIINPVPTATITGSTTVCQVAGAQTITLTGAGGTAPYTFTYSINGVTQPAIISIGNVATISAPVTTIGTFVYKIISVRDASSTLCLNTFAVALQPTATVVVQATSSATIATNTAAVCQDASAPIITFTATNGTAPFTFTYNINAGATQTITTSATSGSVTLPVSMAASGTFVYNLLSVKNTGPTNCTTALTGISTTVVINPIPTATISIAGTNATTVCQNTTQPVVTFGGLGGTAPYTINYTLNGVAQTPIIIASASTTINAPTNIAGVFTYIVTSIKDATSTQCVKTYTTGAPTAIVTVKQLATAAVTASVPTVCQNSAAPFITFTATGGVAPFTFTYKINGGSNLTVTSPFGNSANVPVPTLIAGTYIYTLVSVQESSIVNCVNAQTGTAQVIVHPQPTASFLPPIAPFCELKAITFTPVFDVMPTGSVVSWVWDYGDGTGTHIRPDGNPFPLTYPTAGVKNVTFKTISDKGCESVLFLDAITINVKPKAGFINPGACLADPFANFTDTSKPVGTIALWEWDFGDIGSPTNLVSGSTLAQQNPQHAYLTVGPKSVKLSVTTASGCKADTTQTFFINGVIASSDFILQNPNAVCSNKPVKIKDASAVAVGNLIRVDIYWDNANAPTVFEQDNVPTLGKVFSHNYPISLVDKTYQIRYVSYTGYDVSCHKEVFRDIVVHGAPVAQFTTTFPDVCLNGGPVQLTQANSSTGIGVYMGTGVTQTGSVFTFDPSATGVVPGSSYTISYTASSTAGCDSTRPQQIKVLRPPVVDSFKTVGNLCRINDITFHNKTTNGDGAIVKWIYDWGDGTPNTIRTTGADVTHQYATTGIKTATLTLETGYGCRNIPFPVRFTVNPLPVPRYRFTDTTCLPLANIVFTNTTQTPLSDYTFNWSFELPSTTAANTSTQANPNHTYTTQGPFNTHLIANIIATGCKDSTLIIPIGSNTIHPAPVLRFDAIPDVCLNNGIVSFLLLADQTNGTILGGPGIFSGPGIISADGDFNPLIAGVGSHTITYKWTSTFGCPASITQTVKVLAAPVVDTFKIIGNKCERNKIVFHNTTTQGAGSISSWVYVWGDGMTDTLHNGNDTTHTYQIPQTYTATLQLITNNGCKSALPNKQVTVIVNALPKPRFYFTPIACLPQAKIDFTNTTPAQTTGSLAYNWVFDNVPPTIKTTVNADFAYTTLGAHPVKLIATNTTTFCKDSLTLDIRNSLHPAPTADFSFNKTSACIGENVKVIDGPSNPADGTMTDWTWNYGDNPTLFSGQMQAPHTYATAGTYLVKLTVKNNFGCEDDDSKSFTVHPLPIAYAGRDSVILEGGNIKLTPTVSGNDLTYLWTGTPAPINLSDIHALNPIASPINDITYTLFVTGRGGCPAPAVKVFIKVLKYPVIPNTFTPNNDGVHDTWVIKYLESYPDARVQVFTRAGQLVFESIRYTTPWNGTVNGKSLPFDTYYYILEPGTGRAPITGYVTIVK